MVRVIFTSALIFLFSFFSVSQTTHTINIDGLTFSPDNITIEIGDTIFFNGNSNHPVLQVSKETWDANGDTPLSGGFSFPSGIGKVRFDQAGTFYYICQNHVSNGMKGQITVSAATNSEILENQNFKIFPNPLTIDYLTVLIPNKTSSFNLTIYDIAGRIKVLKTTVPSNDQIRINCQDLYPGAYIIQIQGYNTLYTSKFIKN